MSENIIERDGDRARIVTVLDAGQDSSQASLDVTALKEQFFAKMGFASQDRLGLIRTIRKGVAYNALNVLGDSLSLSVRDVSEIVDISDRTLNRRKQRGALSPEETERVYRVASLIVRATEVMRDRDEAVHWLKTPKKALGGEIPLKLADTEVGADEIKDLLGRIEHGVFA